MSHGIKIKIQFWIKNTEKFVFIRGIFIIIPKDLYSICNYRTADLRAMIFDIKCVGKISLPNGDGFKPSQS